MSNSSLGILMALIAAIAWSVSAINFKSLGKQLEPTGINTLNSILGVLILFLIILFTKSNLFISLEDLGIVFASAIIGISIGDNLFYSSLNKLSPIILSIIVLCGPFFSGILALIFLHEIPSLISLVSILIIIFGLCLITISSNKNTNTIKTKFSGVILAVLSLFCTSSAMVLIKPVLQDNSTLTVTMYRMLISALVLLLYSFCSKKIFKWKSVLSQKDFNFKLFYTISISAIGGFVLSHLAVKYSNIVTASSIMALEPLFILLLLVIFYKYKPKKLEVLGIIIIIIGIISLFIKG